MATLEEVSRQKKEQSLDEPTSPLQGHFEDASFNPLSQAQQRTTYVPLKTPEDWVRSVSHQEETTGRISRQRLLQELRDIHAQMSKAVQALTDGDHFHYADSRLETELSSLRGIMDSIERHTDWSEHYFCDRQLMTFNHALLSACMNAYNRTESAREKSLLIDLFQRIIGEELTPEARRIKKVVERLSSVVLVRSPQSVLDAIRETVAILAPTAALEPEKVSPSDYVPGDFRMKVKMSIRGEIIASQNIFDRLSVILGDFSEEGATFGKSLSALEVQKSLYQIYAQAEFLKKIFFEMHNELCQEQIHSGMGRRLLSP